jgi:uncharacterized membrane protein YjfL (UPF0719 family)
MPGPTVFAIGTTPVAPPGADRFTTLVGWFAWGVTALAVVGLLMVAGALMIQHRRGEIGQHGSAFGMVVTGCILAATAGPIVRALGLAG